MEPPTSGISLPVELWLEVFQHLPLECLLEISLVSKTLRLIAIPAIYKTQRAHPFQESLDYRGISGTNYTTRTRARLQCLTSPHIAPAVEEFFISPYPPHFNRQYRIWKAEQDVAEELFDSLARLPNLRKLVCERLTLTPTRITALSHLQLEDLELDIAVYPSDEIIPVPAKRRFSINFNKKPEFTATVYLLFTHPQSLQEIYFGPSVTESMVLAIYSSATPFSSVHTLDIPISILASPSFIPFLSCFPSLKSIQLRSWDPDCNFPDINPALLDGVIPLLQSYHGSAHLAPLFASNRNLRSAKLWGFEGDQWSVPALLEPDVLADILTALSKSSDLEALEVEVTIVPRSLLALIAACFPRLKSLSINAHDRYYYPGFVFNEIRPNGVEHEISFPIGDALDELRWGTELGAWDGAGAKVAAESFPDNYHPAIRWEAEKKWRSVIWRRRKDLMGGGGGAGTAWGELSNEIGCYQVHTWTRGDVRTCCRSGSIYE